MANLSCILSFSKDMLLTIIQNLKNFVCTHDGANNLHIERLLIFHSWYEKRQDLVCLLRNPVLKTAVILLGLFIRRLFTLSACHTPPPTYLPYLYLDIL